MACSLSASGELSRLGGRLSSQALLQIDQGGHRRGPSFWPRGDAPGRCCGRPGDLPAQLGAAPGLALRWAQRDRTNAMPGHAELLLSIVTVTFPKIRGELANGRGTSRLHSCIRGSVGDRTMMQPCASTASFRGGGPIL